jgi:hypothetical protein
MNYDDWKLATPPDNENDRVYEHCDACDELFDCEKLDCVLINLEPFTLCKSCKNKYETNNLN